MQAAELAEIARQESELAAARLEELSQSGSAADVLQEVQQADIGWGLQNQINLDHKNIDRKHDIWINWIWTSWLVPGEGNSSLVLVTINILSAKFTNLIFLFFLSLLNPKYLEWDLILIPTLTYFL